jgi:hypothetical protein
MTDNNIIQPIISLQPFEIIIENNNNNDKRQAIVLG